MCTRQGTNVELQCIINFIYIILGCKVFPECTYGLRYTYKKIIELIHEQLDFGYINTFLVKERGTM